MRLSSTGFGVLSGGFVCDSRGSAAQIVVVNVGFQADIHEGERDIHKGGHNGCGDRLRRRSRRRSALLDRSLTHACGLPGLPAKEYFPATLVPC
jgi:hypothetical protein